MIRKDIVESEFNTFTKKLAKIERSHQYRKFNKFMLKEFKKYNMVNKHHDKKDLRRKHNIKQIHIDKRRLIPVF